MLLNRYILVMLNKTLITRKLFIIKMIVAGYLLKLVKHIKTYWLSCYAWPKLLDDYLG